MDEFGVLTERFGLKPQGKSAPMAASKVPNTNINAHSSSFASNSAWNPKSSSKPIFNSNSYNGSFMDDDDIFFSNSKPQNVDDFDFFGGFPKNLKQTSNRASGSGFDYDSIFSSANNSSADDIFGGLNSSNANRNNDDDIFGSFTSSTSKQNAPVDDLLGNFGAKIKNPIGSGSVGFDDLIPVFGSTSTLAKGENTGSTKSTFTSAEDPFMVLESNSTTTKSTFIDPLEEFSKLNHSRGTNPASSSNVSKPLRPPPKPGQVLKADKLKSSDVSTLDELEGFAMGVHNNTDGHSDISHAKDLKERQSTKASKFKEAEDAGWRTQETSADDLETFFSMSSRSSSAPKSRAAPSDPIFHSKTNHREKNEIDHRKSSGASSSIKKASSTTNLVDDLSSMFGASPLVGKFEEVEGESEERRRARFERHQRTQNRMAQAIADMNQRDFQSLHEQEERRRIAENIDIEIKRWAAGKEGNMRALLSSLQYVLWPDCGWDPVSLTDLITSASVKKVYRKATLCVHPDKVQQKGATLQQKYTAEKVFDLLKEAWNKFSKEELS